LCANSIAWLPFSVNTEIALLTPSDISSPVVPSAKLLTPSVKLNDSLALKDASILSYWKPIELNESWSVFSGAIVKPKSVSDIDTPCSPLESSNLSPERSAVWIPSVK